MNSQKSKETKKYGIVKNLQVDLDDNVKEIEAVIDNLKSEGSFFEYTGVFHDYDVFSALSKIQQLLYKRYKIIFKDYDDLLTKKCLTMLLSHIDIVEKIVIDEFSVGCIDLSSRGVWKNAMGVYHEETDQEHQNEYEKQLSDFSHSLFLQKLRTQNAFRRRSNRKIKHHLETWLPIVISIFALIISFIGLLNKN